MKWSEENNQLSAEFTFKNFQEAMGFMQQMIPFINKLNHHPKWENMYNTVKVFLQTHDAGNVVTDKDKELAKRMNEVYAKFN